MSIQKLFGIEGARKARGVSVIIDVFRAALAGFLNHVKNHQESNLTISSHERTRVIFL